MRVLLRTIYIEGKGILTVLAVCGLLAGCGPGNKGPQETPKSRTIHISVDESFKPVIDSATSTVRYAIDSILHGQSLGKNVQAAKSSEDVINYVANTPLAVGFIGVSWIGDQDDPQQLAFLKKVNIAALRCVSCGGQTYVK